MLALGDAGPHDAPAAAAPRRCATCCSTPARSTGFGWSCFTRRRGRGRRGARCGARAAIDAARTSTCASTVDPATGTYTIETDRPVCASRAAAASSTTATAATPTTTRRPTDDRRHRPPDAVRVTTLETGSGPRPRRRSTPTTRGPRHADGDDRSCSRAQRRDGRGHGAHHARAARRRDASCASRTSIDNRARDHRLRAHFPLPGDGRRLRRRVRVRGRAPRAHGRGRRARVRAADVPVAPVRRRVRRHRRPRARARRPARVRGRRRRPRARAHAAARRSATSRAPSRSCGRTRPARPMPLDGRAAARPRSAPSTRCCSTPATGGPPTATAPPTRCSCRSSAPASRRAPTRPRARARHRAARRRRRGVGGAPRPRRSRRPRVPHRPRRGPGDRSSTKARPPAAGSSTSAAAPSPPSKARSPSRPWQICTLQLHVACSRDACALATRAVVRPTLGRRTVRFGHGQRRSWKTSTGSSKPARLYLPAGANA